MSSSLRVNTIVPSTGTNVAIGTANGTVTFTDSVNFVLGTGSSIFSPASNTLTFGTNDAERLRVTDVGRVLINATTDVVNTSSAKLQVTHTGGAMLALGRNDATVTNGNDMGKIAFYGNDGGSYEECARITCEADGPHASGDKPSRLMFQTTADGASSPTERLRIDSSGLVGIGTDNPGNVLHLQKNGGDAILELQNSGNGNHSGIFFVRESSGGVNKGAANIHVESNTSGSGSALVFGTGSNISATGSERLRIDHNGNVGIGTENPLNGVDIVQSDSRTRVTAYGHIITRNHNHSVTNYWSIAPRNGGELDIAYGPADSDGTVAADLVTIKSDGKMGVGTGSPTSLIHGQVSSGSAIATLESTATSGEASVSLKGKNSSGTVRTGIFKYDSADMFRIGTTASIPLRFETNDAERMRILPTGGLTFNGDTATANALDDYEEGTLSWRLQRSDNIGAGSNVNTRVTYTKIGNRVYISGYIYTQNTGSSTSNVNIIIRSDSNTSNVATLPYPPNHSGGLPVTGTRTISDNYRNMAVTFQENSSTVYLYRDDGDNNYVKNVNNVSVGASQTHLVLQFCGSYTTNS